MSRLFRACNAAPYRAVDHDARYTGPALPSNRPHLASHRQARSAQQRQKRAYYALLGALSALLLLSVVIVAAARPSAPTAIVANATATATEMAMRTSTERDMRTVVDMSTVVDMTTESTVEWTATEPTSTPMAAGGGRSVVFMLSDGMGPASLTMARLASGRNPLHLDRAVVGTVQTFSSTSFDTDSAAGATAYACGRKSYNGAIAVDNSSQPLGTLLEAAQRRGMPVGLVATSRITHATPAAFSSHSLHRDYEEYIALQQSVGGVDVMFGGGRDQFMVRNDSRLLLDEMRDGGYRVLDGVDSFRALAAEVADDGRAAATSKVIGLFAADHMNYEIDRDPSVEPSLTEMATVALRILQAKARARNTGFFLLVEGSRIDMAAHDNDAPTQVHETLAYDDAFYAVSNFVQSAPEPRPLVVATSDHETGGLSLGLRPESFFEYPIYEWLPDKLMRPTQSTFVIAERMMNASTPNEQAELAKSYVGVDVTPIELAKYAQLVQQNESRVLQYEMGNDLARRCKIGWSTIGHSGVDVNLYTVNDESGLTDEQVRVAGVPLNSIGNRLRGNVANSAVGMYMQAAMGLAGEVDQETMRLQRTLDLTGGGMYMRMEGYNVRKRDIHHPSI